MSIDGELGASKLMSKILLVKLGMLNTLNVILLTVILLRSHNINREHVDPIYPNESNWILDYEHNS